MLEYGVDIYTKNYHRFKVKKKPGIDPVMYHFSDIHFDNPKCNREAFFKHMDMALKENAGIVITGDLLCLMNGKYDPRRSKNGIRPEYNTNDYLDLVINDAADQLGKYANNIMMISSGNHETSVSEKMGTNVIDRLIERMNMSNGSKTVRGGYMGYFTISICASKTNMKTYNVAYDHGHWGGVISKGTQSAVRYAAIFPQADVVYSGHTHDSWIVPQPTFVMNEKKKKVCVQNKWMVRSGTYKEEFAHGEGWAVEKIGMPKFLGCVRTEVVEIHSSSGLKLEHTIKEA